MLTPTKIMDYLRYFEQKQLTAGPDRPRLQTGDIVRVGMKITEGDKERLQIFEGTILGIRGSGPSVTFTVRREVGRFAVERIFPLYSPLITNIDIVKRQKTRRAKLNYLRTAGRRRVKEDEKAMQRHLHEEQEKRRLIEEAQRREEEKQRQAEIAQKQAEDKQQREKERKTEEASRATQTTEKDATLDSAPTTAPESPELASEEPAIQQPKTK